jgi:hypothetical protein
MLVYTTSSICVLVAWELAFTAALKSSTTVVSRAYSALFTPFLFSLAALAISVILQKVDVFLCRSVAATDVLPYWKLLSFSF